jgi:hypothetical protein
MGYGFRLKAKSAFLRVDFFLTQNGMRYTNYRGKGRVTDEAMMVLACMNLKKMANWKWKRAA